jgi:hypothetical protein
MAQVKIGDLVDSLDSEFKKSLAEAENQFAPGASVDRDEVFRFFLMRIYQHCNV